MAPNRRNRLALRGHNGTRAGESGVQKGTLWPAECLSVANQIVLPGDARSSKTLRQVVSNPPE